MLFLNYLKSDIKSNVNKKEKIGAMLQTTKNRFTVLFLKVFLKPCLLMLFLIPSEIGYSSNFIRSFMAKKNL